MWKPAIAHAWILADEGRISGDADDEKRPALNVLKIFFSSLTIQIIAVKLLQTKPIHGAYYSPYDFMMIATGGNLYPEA